MILKGNQRGGARQLAAHLLKTENEHVEVHELRGFMADDLTGALREIEAVSRGTRCQQPLFSVSLNPPESARVPVEVFEEAVDRIEAKLGLEGQPRAIVFHEKEGRRHAHCVWSRINTETMTAVNLPYTKLKLREVSRRCSSNRAGRCRVASSIARRATRSTLIALNGNRRNGRARIPRRLRLCSPNSGPRRATLWV